MYNAILIGNLVKDPEKRTTTSGKQVCNFTIAINRYNRETNYVRVVAWEKLANTCQTFLVKGSKVAVMANDFNVSTYDDKAGKTHAMLEVNASSVEFMQQRTNAPAPVPESTPEGRYVVVDEDLPF